MNIGRLRTILSAKPRVAQLAMLLFVATMLIACGDDNGSSATDESGSSHMSSTTEPVPDPNRGIEDLDESSSSSPNSESAVLSASNLEPVANSSSSFVWLREDMVDSSRLTIYRFLYPRADMSLDTGYFNGDECRFEAEGKFLCEQRSCIAYDGGQIDIPQSYGILGVSARDKDGAYSEYFHTSTDITRLVDINFGDSALTTFIPFADIPEFDRDGFLEQLSVLPAEPCSTLFHFEGNYLLQADGLPEGIILYRDGQGIKGRGDSREYYSALFPKEELDAVKAHIYEAGQGEKSSYNKLMVEYYSELKYAPDRGLDISNQTITAEINDFGCGVVSTSYVTDMMAGLCEGWKIPEDAKVFSYRLINISGKVPENPVQWKLTYMDQYGRGGSLDIVTQFE
ncbi:MULTISPECIES: hypothetical protein [unclassified Fibrobacter]|uniref:hypothetical protein n=1 Tax=unclassified Fibrobacter TaxID=2634177 RepID=UPI00092166D2|nr:MULTISPECIES: hypothetical protein [unclassified Fibrobacter]OWV00928.1 hypothetical protein B7993_15875 [Fibrobacter sp. UWH3]SHL90844.1 hypothetical protein SAMN05720765_13811 [Fibrobacter sp. UWH6]